MNRKIKIPLALTMALLISVVPAFAGRYVRSSARTSVNRSSTSIHRNTNVNIDRDIDVDVHHDYHHHHVDHPVAATIFTAAVIGAIFYTPPPTYTVVVVNGITYYQSGSTWYQPQFAGTTTTYIVVNSPR
jgi:hypothetical protein